MTPARSLLTKKAFFPIIAGQSPSDLTLITAALISTAIALSSTIHGKKLPTFVAIILTGQALLGFIASKRFTKRLSINWTNPADTLNQATKTYSEKLQANQKQNQQLKKQISDIQTAAEALPSKIQGLETLKNQQTNLQKSKQLLADGSQLDQTATTLYETAKKRQTEIQRIKTFLNTAQQIKQLEEQINDLTNAWLQDQTNNNLKNQAENLMEKKQRLLGLLQ